MSQQLINLSPDLKRIQNEGYELEIRNGHALISNVKLNFKWQCSLQAIMSRDVLYWRTAM